MSYPYEFPGAFRYPPFQPSQKLKDSIYLTLRAELRMLDEQIREVIRKSVEIGGFHGGVSDEEEDNHRRREWNTKKIPSWESMRWSEVYWLRSYANCESSTKSLIAGSATR